MPAMIIFNRPPFLPVFTDRTSKDGPNASDGQFMIATRFTGERPGFFIIHGYTPSVNHHYDPEQWLQPNRNDLTPWYFGPGHITIAYFLSLCLTLLSSNHQVVEKGAVALQCHAEIFSRDIIDI